MSLLIYKKIKNDFLGEKKIKKIVERTLISVKKDLKNFDISLHLVGEKFIRELNKQYRGKDSVTDVISFATQDFFLGKQMAGDLGDLFICPDQIKKQAKDFLVSYEEESTRILIHGVLHLCGFDHQEEKEGKRMFVLQEKILKKI